MSTLASPPPQRPADAPLRPSRKRRTSLFAHGEPMVWLTGGSLVLGILMVVGLLLLVFLQGIATFWPEPVVKARIASGRVLMGEITRDEVHIPSQAVLDDLDPAVRQRADAILAAGEGEVQRNLYRTGNFELTGEHFVWIEDFEVEEATEPEWAIVFERVAWGRFYGFPEKFLIDGEVVAEGPAAAWAQYRENHDQVRARRDRRREVEKDEIGRVNARREASRLSLREIEIDLGKDSDEYRRAEEEHGKLSKELDAEFDQLTTAIAKLDAENARFQLHLRTADGAEKQLALGDIVRAYPANQLGFADKLGLYLSRWWEYLTEDPREANSEGGIAPAIIGTLVMTLIMVILVVPFGVLAALYLREYAKAGPVVSAVRIAINNLAGVPSIVFGVFGLGFFCYIVGGWLDGGPRTPLSAGTWFILLLVLAAFVLGALFFTWLRLRKPAGVLRDKDPLRLVVPTLFIGAALLLVTVVGLNPFFEGYHRASLPNPTLGKGALIWASLTLALLTLPVVIVATEEALAAVPGSMREGSYACGASKWQTIRRIVLPRAAPGILTGVILAMARGAGEVAPLMLVGAVKLAPELPVDFTDWSGSVGPIPTFFVHPERSFMHLGFHIFDVGFQSQNSEAAKPMVYTTTLLLIVIVVALNIFSIWIRNRLRRKFSSGGQF